MTERWEPAVVQDALLLEQCREVLSRVSPRAERVELAATKLGIWPRLYLGEDRALKYAFLLPVDGARAQLHVFPGDTLTQARILYADSARADALLRLLDDGWHGRPNFHFGSREAGLAWMNPTAPVNLYINWCLAYVPYARVLEPYEWDRLLDELIRREFASPGDKERFRAAFKSRKAATPRPGLHLWRDLSNSITDTDTSASEVRHELGAVLAALREPLR